ncbi:hypothetical protein HUN01_28590 [Nostoc edaphicum CCNP1411]|uniref:CopG family transcriptional regulator n=1 Tax=Nostoc edaphicum CCNP1411 TaxID=1472755 RepID=A0A7D7QWH7_9NOSO|nr:hypothetical protein [Nostoc edaphicum]QMS91363.1 hypothetical protein HUN01_28590 [Nostoc edaphicum CCNP1411]
MSKLATFRIDDEDWQKFQELAKTQGTSASALLVNFIRSSITSPEVTKRQESGDVESAIQAKLASIDERIENAVQLKLADVDRRIESAIQEKLVA